MAIDPIGGTDKAAPLLDSARNNYHAAAGEHESRKRNEQEAEPLSVSFQRSAFTMGRLGSVNEEKNSVAKSIRESDEGLRKISGVIDRMKEQLGKIVKNWPPFPQESEERKEILMSYVSLRKEILEMTVPAPPESVYVKNKEIWDNLGYPVMDKSAGGVPELSGSSTDQQVRTTVNRLEDAESAITLGRSELVRVVTE